MSNSDGDIERLEPERESAAVGARDQEQVLGQVREALGLVRRPRIAWRSSSVDRLAECELELGPQQRERRPQLVTGVGDELALARERGLEPVEQLVQRLAKTLDLVARCRDRQPLARRLGRDRRGPPAHRLDLAQRQAGEPVAEERREDQRDRACDQQLVAKAGQRLGAVLQRGADDEDAGAAARVTVVASTRDDSLSPAT